MFLGMYVKLALISIVFSCLFFVIENCKYTSHTTNNMGTLVKLQVIIIKNILIIFLYSASLFFTNAI